MIDDICLNCADDCKEIKEPDVPEETNVIDSHIKYKIKLENKRIDWKSGFIPTGFEIKIRRELERILLLNLKIFARSYDLPLGLTCRLLQSTLKKHTCKVDQLIGTYLFVHRRIAMLRATFCKISLNSLTK